MGDATKTKDDSKMDHNSKDDVNMAEIEKKIKHQILESSDQRSEARFNHFTWFVGIVLIIIGFLFGYNVYTNRDDFKRLETWTKERIDEMIGNEKGEPKVIAYSEIEKDLEGSTVDAAFYTEIKSGTTKYYLEFTMFFKNSGDKINEQILLKYYFKSIALHGRIKSSSDDKGYKDDLIFDSRLLPNSGRLFPGASFTQTILFQTESIEKNPNTLHPSMVKVYYGGKEPFVAKFNIRITEYPVI